MASSMTWTFVAARFIVALLAYSHISNAYPYTFFEELPTCPSLPLVKGLPAPSVGPEKARFQVIGRADYRCVKGKPDFMGIRKANVYEIGSLHFTNPAMLKDLSTLKVFSMQFTDNPMDLDEEKLFPGHLFGFLTAKRIDGESQNWKERLHSDAAPVYADVGGAPRTKPIPQEENPEQAMREKIESEDRYRRHRISSMLYSARPQSKTPSSGQTVAALGQSDARSGAVEQDATGSTRNQRPVPNQNNQPEVASNSQGRGATGTRSTSGLAKLRRRWAQAGVPQVKPTFGSSPLESAYGNPFFPNPFVVREEDGKDQPSKGGDHWEATTSKIIRNGDNFGWAHFIDDAKTTEAYHINPVAGVPENCLSGQPDGRWVYPVAFQLVVFRKGCVPGTSGFSESPPMYCAASQGVCPSSAAVLKSNLRKRIDRITELNKPPPVKPKDPYSNQF